MKRARVAVKYVDRRVVETEVEVDAAELHLDPLATLRAALPAPTDGLEDREIVWYDTGELEIPPAPGYVEDW